MANTGFVAATAVAQQADGSFTWSNPGQAITDDGTVSGVIPDTTTYSNRLRFSGFNFNIPDGATINGIRVRCNLYIGSGATATGIHIQLNSAEGETFTPKTNSVISTSSGNMVTLGGTSDTWGDTPTKSSFDSGFSVDLKVNSEDSVAILVNMDALWVEVTYTEATGGSTKNQWRPGVYIIEDEDDEFTLESGHIEGMRGI